MGSYTSDKIMPYHGLIFIFVLFNFEKFFQLKYASVGNTNLMDLTTFRIIQSLVCYVNRGSQKSARGLIRGQQSSKLCTTFKRLQKMKKNSRWKNFFVFMQPLESCSKFSTLLTPMPQDDEVSWGILSVRGSSYSEK